MSDDAELLGVEVDAELLGVEVDEDAELLGVVVEVSLLVLLLVPLLVPLAPMLEVLGLVVVALVLGDVELVLGAALVLGGVLDEPPVLLSVLFCVAGVPPLGAVDESLELPLVCAIAKPPMASAAAAANVVSVFLVVVMSFAP